jgi:hypothetical protein
MVVGEGFEPSKAVPADLQSAPFGHSGTPPQVRAHNSKHVATVKSFPIKIEYLDDFSSYNDLLYNFTFPDVARCRFRYYRTKIF